MRTEEELTTLRTVAAKQEGISRAQDYWQGVSDAIDWVLGAENPAISVWMMLEKKDAT
jgi:hypothetical protein